jgi:putative transposase
MHERIRKTRTLEATLPWLYLKGISTGEMGAALKVLLGPGLVPF